MSEEIIEEYNLLERAITEIEGATIILIIYIVGLFILAFNGKIDGDALTTLLLGGSGILTLLKVWDKR